MKLTKREMLFFLIGVLTIFIIENIYDWKGTKNSFLKGCSDGNKILKK